MNTVQQLKGDNLLIAEFMGWNNPDVDQWETFFGALSISETQYRYSWDWLMPVVTKISECDLQHMGLGYQQGKVLTLFIGSSINDVYQAVLVFITWYNANSSN